MVVAIAPYMIEKDQTQTEYNLWRCKSLKSFYRRKGRYKVRDYVVFKTETGFE